MHILKWFKLSLKQLILYAVIGIILTSSVLYSIEKSELSEEEVVEVVAKVSTSIPTKASCVAFVKNHQYVSYLENGILYVKNMKDSNLEHTIKEDGVISYAFTIEDRNLIVYFVHERRLLPVVTAVPEIKNDEDFESEAVEITPLPLVKKYEEKLTIKTYDVVKKQASAYGSFQVANFSKMKQVTYSHLTNLIYANVEVKSKNGVVDRIFRINIEGNISTYLSGDIYKQLVLLDNADILYYETSLNAVHDDKKRFSYEDEKKFHLLGKDAQNSVYMQSITTPTEIIKVKKNKSVQAMALTDHTFKEVYSNQNGLYLVYTDYVVDINNQSHKMAFDAGLKLLDIYKNMLFMKNDKDEILKVPIK
ncbi:MAG: hypothetical protein H7Y41_03440 [Hyphomonadaceae bacterium]|nr:hypothetical protein [Clostridia bacterium]